LREIATPVWLGIIIIIIITTTIIIIIIIIIHISIDIYITLYITIVFAHNIYIYIGHPRDVVDCFCQNASPEVTRPLVKPSPCDV